MNALPKVSALVIGLTLVVRAHCAYADIRVEERIVMEGFGVMAMANMNGRSVTTIAGDRARMESDMQMQSKLVRMFAKDVGPTATIIRLDEDKVYELDLKKKQYTEETFAETRAKFQQMQSQAAQAQSQPQQQPSPIDESQCEWLEPKVDIRQSGEKASIAGLSAERMTIVASQPCKDKKTGQICEMVLTLDEWLSPEMSGRDEELKFYQAYAQKLGLDMSGSKDVTQRAEALFGRYKGIWSEVATKMRDVKGYPVKTTFALGVGGEQCQAAQGGATGSAQNGAPSAGAPNAGEAVATASGEATGEAAAQKAGQSSLGGIAGQLGGKIAGAFFKKKKEPAPAETAPAATTTPATPTVAAPGVINLMQLTSELISVSHAAADASVFAIPAGFQKVTR